MKRVEERRAGNKSQVVGIMCVPLELCAGWRSLLHVLQSRGAIYVSRDTMERVRLSGVVVLKSRVVDNCATQCTRWIFLRYVGRSGARHSRSSAEALS